MIENFNEAKEIFKKKLKDNPRYAVELVLEWAEIMPEQFIFKMFEDEYGCHLAYNTELYNKAISLLKWVDDKGKGAKWSPDEIEKLTGIDFDTKDYYLLDFAYVMNMLYSDYCNIFTDTNYYIKMTKNYLEDSDYMGDPSERGYKNAKERIKYFEENKSNI